MALKIALYGYGKMGKAIEEAALAHGHQVVLRVDQHNAGTPPGEADVAIEFSKPTTTLANMRLCMEHHVPVVVGTTGWYDRMNDVRTMVAQLSGALLWASNFSIGVNLFFKLNEQLARLMKGHANYAASVEETHHVHKLDAPSGTAITLAKDLLACNNRYTGWALQTMHDQVAGPGQLPITSHRIDEVPGTHAVQWRSEEDRITITHEAFGRQGFATGAVVAAEWLKGRTGLFTLDDVLRHA